MTFHSATWQYLKKVKIPTNKTEKLVHSETHLKLVNCESLDFHNKIHDRPNLYEPDMKVNRHVRNDLVKKGVPNAHGSTRNISRE